jgi:hypothetical protein
MQLTLIFWPLRPLVLHDVATLHPVCLCAIEDGWYGRPDLRRERVRCYSGRYPCRYRGTDVIMVEWPGSCWVRAWFPCSCSLCMVTFVPSAGVGAAVGGPHGSPSCQRAPRVPRARQKYAKGSSASMTSWGLRRGENWCSGHLSRSRPFRKARMG